MSNVIEISSHEDLQRELADKEMCKLCVQELLRMYPDHYWVVQSDVKNRIIDVFNLNIHDRKAYTIKVRDWRPFALRHELLKAGGEILERGGQPRGAFNETTMMQAPRDAAGNIKGV